MNARHSYVHVIVGTMPDAILLPGQCNIRDIKHRSLGWNIADELSDTFHFLIGKWTWQKRERLWGKGEGMEEWGHESQEGNIRAKEGGGGEKEKKCV